MSNQPGDTAPALNVEEYIAAMPDGMGALNDAMGIELVEISADRVVGTMPVKGNTQPYGLLHGGASAVLAETLGSVGAMLHAGANKIAVGVDLNCTHHRSVRTGLVTGVATPAHAGRTSATYDIVITDERDKRVCTARLTCVLRPAAQPTQPDPLGYPAESAEPSDSTTSPAPSDSPK
jgi:1,4-dihydroxy-2-naphthoyl-CoA hydrolase